MNPAGLNHVEPAARLVSGRVRWPVTAHKLYRAVAMAYRLPAEMGIVSRRIRLR